MLATPIAMATFPTTPTPWSPRRLRRPLMVRRRPLSHSPFHMAVSTTTATATPATLLSRLSLARPSSPPSTTTARGPLMLSPLLMPMLRPTLGSPMDTTAMATDSTGHTDMDTVATMVDIPMDTGPTDIPTTDKDIPARFLYGYLPRYYPNVFREQISKY